MPIIDLATDFPNTQQTEDVSLTILSYLMVSSAISRYAGGVTTQTSLEISNGLAWHYTSAAGLLGIIEGHSLRATSAAFMNDANEMKTGVLALRLAFERMKHTLSDEDRKMAEASSLLRESSVIDSFLVSASSKSDLLTIWRNYGGGQVAYAIGFDRSIKLAPRENIGGEAHPAPPPG